MIFKKTIVTCTLAATLLSGASAIAYSFGIAPTNNTTITADAATSISGTTVVLGYDKNTAYSKKQYNVWNGSKTVKKTFYYTPFTGNQIKPYVTVKLKVNGKTTTLKKGTDYTVSYGKNLSVANNEKECYVKITGKGKYKNSITKNFKISQASISIAALNGSVKMKVNGSNWINPMSNTKFPSIKKGTKPSISIKVGKVTLKENTDYTFTYNKNTGYFTIDGTGKWNSNLYKGSSFSGTFKLKK